MKIKTSILGCEKNGDDSGRQIGKIDPLPLKPLLEPPDTQEAPISGQDRPAHRPRDKTVELWPGDTRKSGLEGTEKPQKKAPQGESGPRGAIPACRARSGMRKRARHAGPAISYHVPHVPAVYGRGYPPSGQRLPLRTYTRH